MQLMQVVDKIISVSCLVDGQFRRSEVCSEHVHFHDAAWRIHLEMNLAETLHLQMTPWARVRLMW
jgi:hypothetical protein